MLSNNVKTTFRLLDGNLRVSAAGISTIRPKPKGPQSKEKEMPQGPPPEMDMSETYQFLKKSMLPSYYFQESLPRLPIPTMEDTMKRYIEALEPIVSVDQLEATKILAKEFQNGIGKTLNERLIEKDKSFKFSSYISSPWFDMYLKDRQPLPINYNPGLVFAEDPEVMRLPMDKRQLVRTTNLLVSALRFKHSLDSQTLEPEVFHLNPSKSDTDLYRRVMKFLPTKFATYGSYLFKAFPLDMSQYPSLFRNTRVPRKGCDILFKGEIDTKHIIVMRNGYFYYCEVTDPKGNILPVQELMGVLNDVMHDSAPRLQYPMGLMTTENRDKWATARDQMISKSTFNLKTLYLIDSALFVLCMDDEPIGDDPATVTRRFLHADGTNRWFDKSFSLITTRDGWAGLNFEHSWGDGVAIMRFFNDIHRDALANKWSNNMEPKKPYSPPQRLFFELDAQCEKYIAEAGDRFKSQTDQLEIHPFMSEEMGKKDCKKLGISPDSFMQMVFQIAYYRLYKKTPATYESCSTAAFRHGRTETIRPATMFTKELSEVLSQPDWKNNMSQVKELLKKCSEKHGDLTKKAAMGQGFDRHLFALKNIAEKNNMDIPALFLDHSYKKINYNFLSTSTLSSPAVKLGAFGPVVNDGFGIAYQIWDTGLGCLVTTYKGGKDGKAFTDSCSKTFQDLKSIVSA